MTIVERNLRPGNFLWRMEELERRVRTLERAGVMVGGGDGRYLLRAGMFVGTATWDPASLAAGATVSTVVSVPGAAVGDVVVVGHSQMGANDLILAGHVQSADTVRVVLNNQTGGVIDVASGVLNILLFRVLEV